MILDESSVDEHLGTGGEEAAKVALVEFAPAVPAKGDRALQEDDLAVAGLDADVQERVDAGDGCLPWVDLVCHRAGDSLGGLFLLLFEDGLEQAFLAAEVVVQGATAEAGGPYEIFGCDRRVPVLDELAASGLQQGAAGRFGVELPARLDSTHTERILHTIRISDTSCIWRKVRCRGRCGRGCWGRGFGGGPRAGAGWPGRCGGGGPGPGRGSAAERRCAGWRGRRGGRSMGGPQPAAGARFDRRARAGDLSDPYGRQAHRRGR